MEAGDHQARTVATKPESAGPVFNQGGGEGPIEIEKLVEIAMARTDRFRQQHNELMALAVELQSLLRTEKLAVDATAARGCLGRLMGKLTLHLAAEDSHLYPELKVSKDLTLARLADQFAVEMKGTHAKVAAYNQRWSTATAIRGDASGFCKETREVLTLLGDRIKRENQVLYAAADRI